MCGCEVDWRPTGRALHRRRHLARLRHGLARGIGIYSKEAVSPVSEEIEGYCLDVWETPSYRCHLVNVDEPDTVCHVLPNGKVVVNPVGDSGNDRPLFASSPECLEALPHLVLAALLDPL